MNEKTFQLADYKVVAVAAGLLLIVSIIALAKEADPAWSDQQDEVRAWVADHLGEERAASVPMGLRQIFIPELERVDRCITCHTTIDWGEDLREAPHPARSHPNVALLRDHPIEKFGCTLCHGGQGAATEKEAAHGNLPHWEEPLLDTRRARKYGLTRGELTEMRCNVCHRGEAVVEGMPLINEAKAVVKKRRCARCHMINGVGASKAPDLTREGDKHPTHYHFPESWAGEETAFAWHIEHFKEPFAIVPDTMMPSYTFTDKQVEALSLLVLSWRSNDLPSAWIPRPETDEEEPEPPRKR